MFGFGFGSSSSGGGGGSGTFPYGISTSTPNTYTVSLTPAATFPFTDGANIEVYFTNANTGAANLNVAGHGALPIVNLGNTALVANDIKSATTYVFAYVSASSSWQLIGLANNVGSDPIVRYVYLVQDASDAARMGGTSNNTYTTFQTAYNAANVLQISLGGSNKVELRVGNITVEVAGNLTLSAAYNSNVIIVGAGKSISGVSLSILGNIIATNATGTGFTINLTAQQVAIGNVTSNGGSGGSGGSISIYGVNTSLQTVTSNGDTNGSGGVIICEGCDMNIAVSTGSGSGDGSDITLTKCSCQAVSSIGGTTGGTGFISVNNIYTINGSATGALAITMTKNGNTGSNVLSVVASSIGSITQTNNSSGNYNSTVIVNSDIGGVYTRTATSTGGWSTTTIQQVMFNKSSGNVFAFSTAAATNNLIGTMIMEFCYLNNGNFNITHSGASGSMGTLTMSDCIIFGTTTVAYGSSVTKPGTYVWSRNRFNGAVTLTAGSNGLNVYEFIDNTTPGSLPTYDMSNGAIFTGGVLTLDYLANLFGRVILQNGAGQTISSIVTNSDIGSIEYNVTASNTVLIQPTAVAGIGTNQIALETSSTLTLTGRTNGSDFIILRKEGTMYRQIIASVLV